jgi:preprotein translocase subunit YajC
MFITPAYAQAAPADPGSLGLVSFLPFILIIAVMYFLMIRPQQKRMREHREMIASLKRKDVVVTAGGIVGKIVNVGDDELLVEVADGVRMRIVKNTIAELRAKAEPFRESRRARDEDEEDEPADDDEAYEDETPARKPVKAASASRSVPAARSGNARNRGKAKPAQVVRSPAKPAPAQAEAEDKAEDGDDKAAGTRP